MKIQYSILVFIFIKFTGVVYVSGQSLYFPPLTGNEWVTLAPDSLGWCQEKIDQLYDYLEEKNTKAFIVLKDGKIVLERYFGTFTADSTWYWASAGKSLTSFLVGIAQQEGALDIEDATSMYLGEGWTSLPGDKEQLIKVKNQLSMNSGLDDLIPNRDCTLPECLTYRSDAGQRWAYHNAPYTLLDQVIENATQRNLNQYIFQKLTLTTGITGLYIPVDYNNVFFSKARSMAKFGLLMLNNGTWNTTPVLSDANYLHEMKNSSQQLNPAYGYLWWLNGKSFFKVPGLQVNFSGFLSPNAPADMYAALGKNGQFLNVVPSQNLVFIRMGNSPGEDVPFLYNDSIWQYMNQLNCTVSDKQNETEENTLLLYPLPANEKLHIEWQGYLSELPYQIFNINGRLLISGFDSTVSIHHLPPGLYLMEIQSPNGNIRKRWLKQ